MLKRIYDKYHSDLIEFRESAILECGGSLNDIHLRGSYKSITEHLINSGAARIEEIYRFTEEKWSRTAFDFIDCHYAPDGKITNIAGAKQYGCWMRGAIYHFGLKKYCLAYPSILFQPNGQLNALIEYVRHLNLKGIFISIYPHENRLRALSKALKSSTGISTTGDINLIRMLRYKGTYMFNNVLQDFFVIELDKNHFDISEIAE